MPTPLLNQPLARVTLGNKTEIHYAEGGSGTPLVFVHGGFGDWTSWEPQWEAFTPYYRCISYSRRYSLPNRNAAVSRLHSVFDEAEDLELLLDEWLADPAILVGTSYGAYTALALALRSAHKVKALVLAEPPLMRWADRMPGGLLLRQAFERDVQLPGVHAFERGDDQHAVTLLAEGINGTAAGTSATTELGLARRLQNANAMRALLCANDPFPDLDSERVRRLDVRTLLLAGEKTEPIHDVVYRSLCSVMTQAEHARVPSCGHGAHRDNPREFNAMVLAFLATHGL